MKAIDYSRFSTDNKPVPVGTFQKIRALFPSGDMLLNIPGGWHGESAYDAAEQSILNAIYAGFSKHGLYVALNTTIPGKEAVERAVAAAGPQFDHVSVMPLDIELATTRAIVDAAVAEIQALNRTPWVYSAHWAWDQFMDNCFCYNTLPLWNAYYDNDPDIDFCTSPYGGWTLAGVVGEQYTGTTQVDGIGFDFSQMYDEKVDPTAGLAGLGKAWQADMADLAVNAADLIHTPGDALRLSLHTIYTDRRNTAWQALLGGNSGGK